MWRRVRERIAVVGLGFTLACGTVALGQQSTAPPPAKVLWHRTRSFFIPVTVAPEHRSVIREMILFVSDDAGASYRNAGRTTPTDPRFSFRAPRDGEYWFAIKTVDTRGKEYPAGSGQAEPSLKVIVDATKPTIMLQPKGRRGSQAAVGWEVKDENLALRSMILEYQAEGARDWRQVPMKTDDFRFIGEKSWDAGTADPVRVRLTIRDRAGNSNSVEETLPEGLAAEPSSGSDARLANSAPPMVTPISSRSAPTPSADMAEDENFTRPEPPPSTPPGLSNAQAESSRPTTHDTEPAPAQTTPSTASAAGSTLLVASPKFPLKYEVEDAGPNGPALVELWVTRDGGRTWSRQPEDVDKQSPYNVDLGSEGTFGLCLVVQSASGLGDPAPAPGERPRSWVEVDSTAPTLTLDRPKVGAGVNAGKLAISWRSGDAHPAERPIRISYRADRPDAPWTPITDWVENTGRFIWNVPPNIPPRFHLRVDAVDSLGNHAMAETTDGTPVVLDRARPRGKIIGLDSSAQNAGDGAVRR